MNIIFVPKCLKGSYSSHGEDQIIVNFNFRLFVSGTRNYFNCLDLVSNSNYQGAKYFFTYLNAKSKINKD